MNRAFLLKAITGSQFFLDDVTPLLTVLVVHSATF